MRGAGLTSVGTWVHDVVTSYDTRVSIALQCDGARGRRSLHGALGGVYTRTYEVISVHGMHTQIGVWTAEP